MVLPRGRAALALIVKHELELVGQSGELRQKVMVRKPGPAVKDHHFWSFSDDFARQGHPEPGRAYNRTVKLPFKLPELGLLGPRRAASLAVLGWWASIYTLVALNVDGPWVRPFIGLATCYGLAFFAVASGWFWGRWFASGLGWSDRKSVV